MTRLYLYLRHVLDTLETGRAKSIRIDFEVRSDNNKGKTIQYRDSQIFLGALATPNPLFSPGRSVFYSFLVSPDLSRKNIDYLT
jgi:hypothetical protein